MYSLMMNSMRASPTPSFGSMAVRNARSGLPRLTMISVCGRGQFAQRRARVDLERQRALIDVPDIALGAGDGHHGAGLQRLLGVVRADHGRNAELAGDDGGMTGSSAALGDDRGGDLHHRLPVRAWSFGHQHLAGLETAEIASRSAMTRTGPLAIFSPTARPVASTLPLAP